MYKRQVVQAVVSGVIGAVAALVQRQAELAANMAEDVTCLELVKFPDLVTELKQDKIEAIVVDYVVAEDLSLIHI